MRNGTSLNMIGSVYFSDDVTINLGQGWNWIGYLPMAEMSLEDALSQLNPQEGDIIKDQAGFSVYQGDSWVGTLNTVKLGEGLMYYSHAETSFKYPFSRIVEYQEAESDKSPMRSYVFDKKWGYNIHDYPDNITIIAQATANDVVMPAGTYT